MLNHITVHVNDVQKSKDFYTKALAPLGYAVTGEYPEWNLVGIGAGGKSDTWLVGDGAKQEVHVAYDGTDKAAVEAFYKAALAAGGADNGAPGYRKDYTPGYYAAFVKDLDGHNIEVVFMDPSPAKE